MPPLAAADWLQQVQQKSLQPLPTFPDLVLGHARAYQDQNDMSILNVVILGGSEKIRAIQAIKASGRLINRGGMEFPLTIYLKRPGLTRMDANLHGKSIIHAFDGTDTWTINPLTG